MVAIIPSILVQTPEQLVARLRLIETAGIPVAQLDVADRTFAPTVTFHDPEFIDQLQPVPAFEVHLMTAVTPDSIHRWNRVWVQKIIFHIEATSQPRRIIQAIAEHGKRVGLAISPQTPITAVQPFLGLVDTVLVLGGKPGWSGQEMLPGTTLRVQQTRRIYPRGNIEVDIGVNAQTVPVLAAAGANLLVVGSALTENTIVTAYQQLTILANAAYQKNQAG